MSRTLHLAVCLTIVLLAGAAYSGEATSSWTPERAITIVVGGGPGGGLDAMTRVLMGRLKEYLNGATIVVENNGAAGGSLAAEAVRKAPADGYTILSNNNGIGTYAVTGNSDVTYNDYDMLILIANGNPTFQVPGNSDINTMEELLELLKEEDTTACHSGVGGMPFMPEISMLSLIPGAMEKVTFVPYDSGKQCANALATSEVDWGISDVIEGLPNWPDKLAKPLCIFKPNDVEVPGWGVIPSITRFMDIPRELMISGSNYRAYSIRKGVPPEIKKEIENAFVYAFNSPEFQEFLKKNALTPAGLTGQDAQDMFIEMSRRQSWLLYDLGFTDQSPEVYKIERP